MRNERAIKKSGHDVRGITLTEILIAISITTMVFMGAYAMFSSAIRQFTEGTNQLEAQRNARRIIAFFRNRISASVPPLKMVDIGEKAPTGLSCGLEINSIDRSDSKIAVYDTFYKTSSETYYFEDGKIMVKDGKSRQPQKKFGNVKSLYFKIFHAERNGRRAPLAMVQVTAVSGNQTASYESMILPVYVNGLISADGLVIPIFNSYSSYTE